MKNQLHIALFLFLVFGCSQEKETQVKSEKNDSALSVDLSSHKATEGEVRVEDGIIRSSGSARLEYEVYIPESGRYRVSVSGKTASDTAVLWVEDHIHNKDNRTYNITGSMYLTEETNQTVKKEGSPMREGVHAIRLHAEGELEVDGLKFELMRPHENTPQTLTQNMEGEEWELVWSDEFEGTGIPDTSKWTYDVGNWGWGNGELQYYTVARPENARLEEGNLIIEAHKNDRGEAWTSARLTTRGKVSFIYGKIEFRAKVPAEKGNWAAGWTLGDSYVDELSWPYCGEIDILESVGYEMDNETGNGIAHASAHCGAYYFKLGNQPTGTIEVENMNEAYHTYAVEWTPEYIKAFVDGEHYFTYDDTSTELSWPFSEPQNLILNLAMGGGWGGLMGMDPTVESQKMVVDYVRVYQKKNGE